MWYITKPYLSFFFSSSSFKVQTQPPLSLYLLSSSHSLSSLSHWKTHIYYWWAKLTTACGTYWYWYSENVADHRAGHLQWCSTAVCSVQQRAVLSVVGWWLNRATFNDKCLLVCYFHDMCFQIFSYDEHVFPTWHILSRYTWHGHQTNTCHGIMVIKLHLSLFLALHVSFMPISY